VYQTTILKGAPISIIDIGAAIGDTVLLLDTSCPSMIEKYYCVDGDEDFFNYLETNLSPNKRVTLIKAFLSANEGKAKNLVKIHPGTASAQGCLEISTISLDQLAENRKIGNFDLLKVDVDGYDGLVLQGAKETIIKNKPTIIFEWPPSLCVDTGNNWIDHFNALTECGYDRFIFFSNYGHFSHFMTIIDVQAISLLAKICMTNKHTHAVYFDVIAIHNNCTIEIASLASLEFAKTHKAPC